MSQDFLPPYQFSPVRAPETATTPGGETDHARHDRWMGARHGRIVCTLTLETPTALGLERRGDSAPFLAVPVAREFAGTPAFFIPGNSLRGMTAAILEAITQSTMRALRDRAFSIDVTFNNSKALGSIHEYFEAISPALLPLGSPPNEKARGKPRGRSADPAKGEPAGTTELTFAERLFGVVEIQSGERDEHGFMLASRLRFSDARWIAGDSQPLDEEVHLAILGTPKPNSHNLYWRDRLSPKEYIKKGDLAPGEHYPNGRKFYLHATEQMIRERVWAVPKEAKRSNLQVRTQPFKAGQTFAFHIDYANLTDAELGALLTALRPAEEFRHKLGMGKPIGLGSVRVDVQGVFEIDRVARCSVEGFSTPRYTSVGSDPFATPCDDVWSHDTYAAESGARATAPSTPVNRECDAIDEHALAVVQAIGRWPNQSPGIATVAYPFTVDEKGEFAEAGYSWFVKNDRAPKGQHLPPVDPDKPLPVMTTYRK